MRRITYYHAREKARYLGWCLGLDLYIKRVSSPKSWDLVLITEFKYFPGRGIFTISDTHCWSYPSPDGKVLLSRRTLLDLCDEIDLITKTLYFPNKKELISD